MQFQRWLCNGKTAAGASQPTSPPVLIKLRKLLAFPVSAASSFWFLELKDTATAERNRDFFGCQNGDGFDCSSSSGFSPKVTQASHTFEVTYTEFK